MRCIQRLEVETAVFSHGNHQSFAMKFVITIFEIQSIVVSFFFLHRRLRIEQMQRIMRLTFFKHSTLYCHLTHFNLIKCQSEFRMRIRFEIFRLLFFSCLSERVLLRVSFETCAMYGKWISKCCSSYKIHSRFRIGCLKFNNIPKFE